MQRKKNRKMLLSMQQLLVSNYFCKRIVFYLIPQKSSTYLYFFFIYIRVPKKKHFSQLGILCGFIISYFFFFFCTASKLGQAFCPNLVTFFKTNFRDCKHFLQNLDVDSFKDLVFIAIKNIYIMIATKKHFAG